MTIPFLHLKGTVMAIFQTAASREKSETSAQTIFCDEW